MDVITKEIRANVFSDLSYMKNDNLTAPNGDLLASDYLNIDEVMFVCFFFVVKIIHSLNETFQLQTGRSKRESYFKYYIVNEEINDKKSLQVTCSEEFE